MFQWKRRSKRKPEDWEKGTEANGRRETELIYLGIGSRVYFLVVIMGDPFPLPVVPRIADKHEREQFAVGHSGINRLFSERKRWNSA